MRCFKQLLAYGLVLNVLASTLASPLVYLNFSLRQQYIYQVLCIKKDQPITVCGGQCYLNAQLQNVFNQQTPAPQPDVQVAFMLFSQVLPTLQLSPYRLLARLVALPPGQEGHVQQVVSPVFKPPPTGLAVA